MLSNIEAKTLDIMIKIFCRNLHASNGLCDQCSDLLEYAQKRLSNCPFGSDKPSCKNCHIHCYSAKMRDSIRQVMRYAGPRMIIYHPFLTLRHLWRTFMPAKFQAKPLAVKKAPDKS